MKTTLLILLWCAVAVAQPLPHYDAQSAYYFECQKYVYPPVMQLRGDGTNMVPTNIIIHTNYPGTIQVGTNIWTVADLLRSDPIVHPSPWMSISTTNAELISIMDAMIHDWFTNTFRGQQKQRAAEMAALFTVPPPKIQISYGWRFWRDLPPGNMFTNPAELSDPQLYPLLFRIKP